MLCPFADILLVSTNTGGPMGNVSGFVAHSQVGYGSLYTAFNRSERKASTHFWISQKGRLEQYVDTDVQAWAHGPGNAFFWSSEFEGMSYNDGPQEMDGDPFTSAQIDKAGELIAWLHGLADFPIVINRSGVSGAGLTPHRDLMQTACPGKLRLSQYPELVLATLRHLDAVEDEMPTGPVYAYDTNGILWVAALGHGTTTIYMRRITIEPDWVPVPGGGVATSQPTLAPGADGAMTVGTRGADGAAWRNSYDAKKDRWSGWLSDGGKVA